MGQAQVLAYIDVYMLLVVLFTGILFILPLMRRVRADQAGARKQESAGGVEGLPAAASDWQATENPPAGSNRAPGAR